MGALDSRIEVAEVETIALGTVALRRSFQEKLLSHGKRWMRLEC